MSKIKTSWTQEEMDRVIAKMTEAIKASLGMPKNTETDILIDEIDTLILIGEINTLRNKIIMKHCE